VNAAVLNRPTRRPSAIARFAQAIGETLTNWRELFDDGVWLALIAVAAFAALRSAPAAQHTLDFIMAQLPQLTIR